MVRQPRAAQWRNARVFRIPPAHQITGKKSRIAGRWRPERSSGLRNSLWNGIKDINEEVYLNGARRTISQRQLQLRQDAC